MEQEIPETDIHIIGLGRIGFGLYVRLLKAIRECPEMGNVYGYKSGDETTQRNFLGFLSAANSTLSAEDAVFLRHGKRTTIQEYETLAHLAEKLHAFVERGRTKGRKELLICLRNYDLTDMGFDEDRFPQDDTSGPLSLFKSTFFSDSYTPQACSKRWEEEKERWKQLQTYEAQYKQQSRDLYLAMLQRRGLDTDKDWFANRTKELDEIIYGKHARRGSAASGVIAVQEFARAVGSTDAAIDVVFMVSNPVDVTTYVYAAETGRVPETVCCPQDNDRIRYGKVIERRLREKGVDASRLAQISTLNMMSIGAHNQWNMVVRDPLRSVLFPLFSGDVLAYDKFLEEVALEVNQLAEGQLGMTRTTPNDYDTVLFTAVLNTIKNQGRGEQDPTKIIQYSLDAGMYVGWPGIINNMEVRGAELDQVFPVDVDNETLAQWIDGKKPCRTFLNTLTEHGLLKKIHEEKSRTKREIREKEESKPQTYTTKVDPQATKRQRLNKGEYFVTTYYQDKQFYLAFMQQEDSVFHVVSLVPFDREKMPRTIAYDAETKELYSAHRTGIDAIRVTQLHKSWREVLRVDELLPRTGAGRTKDSVGITSLVIQGDEIHCTLSGYGIGTISRQSGVQQCSWASIARYATTDHIDAMQVFAPDSSEKYVALSGGSLVFGDGKKWEASLITDGTLEALVRHDDALIALATMDNHVEFVEWSLSAAGIVKKQSLEYTPKSTRLQRTAALHTALGYRMRLRAATNGQEIMAVLYDGTAFKRRNNEQNFTEIPNIHVTDPSNHIGVDVLHASLNGFITSGLVTKVIRFAGNCMVPDTVSGFGYDGNPARYMTTITI